MPGESSPSETAQKLIEQAAANFFDANGKTLDARIRPESSPYGNVGQCIDKAIRDAQEGIANLQAAKSLLKRED